MNITSDVDVMIKLEQVRLEKIYGKEITDAVGHLLSALITNVALYSKVEGLSPSKLLQATSDTILAISKMSHDYQNKMDKAPNN